MCLAGSSFPEAFLSIWTLRVASQGFTQHPCMSQNPHTWFLFFLALFLCCNIETIFVLKNRLDIRHSPSLQLHILFPIYTILFQYTWLTKIYSQVFDSICYRAMNHFSPHLHCEEGLPSEVKECLVNTVPV